MQIRLANKQDEPAVSKLVFEVMEEFGLSPEPLGSESDLKNIEGQYFGHNGVFLVAEDERSIVGIAGARRSNDLDLELVRLAVAKSWRGKKIARQLIESVFKFAGDLDYKRILVEPARQYPGSDRALMHWGFTSDPSEDAQPVWYFDLQSQHLPQAQGSTC